MTVQLSTAVRTARVGQIEPTIGTAAILKLRTGAPPATPATADSGTVVATMNLPSDYMGAASAGAVALLGTWQDTSADAAGTVGHFRIYDSAGTTCHIQGTAGQTVTFATNALTAANGNVLNFASTTGVVVGMNIAGTGVAAGATVVAVTSTTVTMSATSTAGVASAASIAFSYDMAIDNATLTLGQQVSVSGFTLTDGNA